MEQTVRCLWCGKGIESQKGHRQYCNSACRNKAWQKRKYDEGASAVAKRDAEVRTALKEILAKAGDALDFVGE